MRLGWGAKWRVPCFPSGSPLPHQLRWMGMDRPWTLLFSGVGTVEGMGQRGGCLLPRKHQVWGRVHSVIIRQVEVGGVTHQPHPGFLTLE